MSAAKHTPGPWVIENYTDITGSENSPEIGCVGKVDVAYVYLRTAPGRTKFNGLLIAAAPEMLEALKAAVEQYGKPGGPWNVPSDPGGWLERARAGIAKAEGRAE